MTESLIERLRTRAHIRRTIRAANADGKNENDRIADLLEEAADELEKWRPMTQEEFEQDKGA